MSTLLGKWAREKEAGGDFEVIEVIDVSNDIAFLKGNLSKPINIGELGTTYQRLDSIASDPFASPDLAELANIDSSLVMHTAKVEKDEKLDTLSKYKEHEIQEKSIKEVEVVFAASNPDEVAIESAIKASKSSSSIEVTLSIELPISIDKLVTVSDALSIDYLVASSVLSKMTKIDVETIKDIFAKSLIKAMSNDTAVR